MKLPDAMLPLFRVWSHRNYAWLMGGMTPNLVTVWMQRIGISWLAWELTNTNAWVGATVAADYAPMVVMAPFVGAYVDRVDPVRVQKITQWLMALVSAAMGILVFTGLMTIWVLMALVLTIGFLQVFSAVARHAIVPVTVPRPEIPTALACDSAIFNAARFVGPAIAALLLPFYGVGIMFIINAVGCLSYLTGLYMMRLAPPERAERGHANGIRGILAEIGEGVAYVRGHVGIGPMFFLLTVGAIWVRPLQDLLPGFADEVFHAGSSGLGWLTAGMGVGAMFSAMAVAMYGRTGGLTLIMMMAFLVNMIATLGFVATSSLWFAILMGAVWGATLTLMTTAAQAVVQSAVDNSLRARVMSIYSMIYRGAPFVGALVIGAAADVIGLQPAFAIATLICVPAWLLIMVRRRSMTLALEGQASDLDRQLTSAARGFAAMQYERLADLRACVRRVSVKAAVEPAAKRLRSMGRRTQATLGEARIGERVSGALQRCRLGLAELRSRVRESRRPGKDVGEHSKR